jgi:toxin CcdB
MSVMATHLMAAVPKSELVTPVANLTSRHDEIIAALDILFQGF